MEIYIKKQFLITSWIYLGQLVAVYTASWSAPIIPMLQDPELTPLPDALTDEQISWVGSVIFIGVIIGPSISSFLSNAKGRKPAFLLGCLVNIISFLLLVIPFNYAMILAGRLLNGFGCGIIAVTNVVYLGEIASTNIRGIILTGILIATSLGSLAAYAIVPYVSYRVSIYIGLAITTSYMVGVFFIPESPVYQILKGKDKEAKDILVSLGRPNDIDDILLSKADVDKTNKRDWIQVFTIKSNRKALFITITLGILQAMSGVQALTLFTTTLFDLVGSRIDSNICTIITGATKLVSSCIALFFVERAGRKMLLLWSTAVCSLILAVLGTYFYLDANDHPIVSDLYWLPLAAMVIFFVSYHLGFGAIPDTLTGEMFEANDRSIGSTISNITGSIFAFIVATTFIYMINGLGSHVTFWIFSGSCAVAFIFSMVFVPETKGKSLYEIQIMLSK